jgi:hypothetical protein
VGENLARLPSLVILHREVGKSSSLFNIVIYSSETLNSNVHTDDSQCNV